MHASLLKIVAAGLLTGAAAQTTHVVTVGSTENAKSLIFEPTDVSAAAGDTIQFQFYPRNHTVTQSTFESPCKPIAEDKGINSGFNPVAPNAQTLPTYSVKVADTTPMYFYCAQGPHCELGMVMTVNANASPNNFEAYKAAAAKVQGGSVAAKTIQGGEAGTIAVAQAAKPPTK